MYQAPRGTQDILPSEQPYWRFVEETAAHIARLYGYQPITLPTFEDTALFARSVGEATDIVQKEMYTFPDRGGGSLTLRPEGTAPVCRAYMQHGMASLPQPVRLYYLASIFRYERPQAGRYREHHQFGCEAIGDGNPALDAEVIEMAWRFFESLGLERLSLQLNSIGCRVCRPPYVALLKEHYAKRKANLCPDCRQRMERNPLRLFDCKNEACQSIALSAPGATGHLCPACREHFNGVEKHLAQRGLAYSLNERLVRGLDYYTRTVFEVQPEEEGSQSAIGGGGRYDDLIEMLGGRPTPGIGFGTGIERIILNLKRQQVPIPPLSYPKVFVAYVGERAGRAAAQAAGELRRAGIGAILATGGKSLKSQLRQANSLGTAYSVIIGEEELAGGGAFSQANSQGTPYSVIIGEEKLAGGNAIVRDMDGATQETVPLAGLASHLKDRL